ncbi:NADP-dependent oxidoreductase [Streptomyces shenzhenensis]|uniref:NADP-dependent oxidoreductase n=1 Tax=Streptomyces shenzhenensis TaxID=943815 RepID=UPI0036AB35A7
MISREIRLRRYPSGRAGADDFVTVERAVRPPAQGEVRVRNLLLSLDPYMRDRMDPMTRYVEPFRLDEPMTGRVIGEVVISRSPGLPAGARVVHQLGWREVAQGPSSLFERLPEDGLPLEAHLSLLGMTGLTAWVGLTQVARMAPGSTVLVSAAAGAVGSTVGLLARRYGAGRVIGSAGGPAKRRLLLDRLGFDEAIDYRAAPIREQLRRIAADGVDVYFDNVGGDHLEAAIDVMRDHGVVVVCGAISGYDAETRPPGPDNLEQIMDKALRLEGFRVSEYVGMMPALAAELAPDIAAGRIESLTTVYEGLDNAVTAFLDLMSGRTTGKTLVRLGP